MPKLAYPQLHCEAAPETTAFRTVVSVLRQDPVLKRLVKQWAVWDGSSEDLWEPSFATCPFLRLSPYPDGSDWATEIQHASPLILRVQAAVAGTDSDQIMNFWNAIRSAIFPSNQAQKTTVQGRLQGAGILKPVIAQSAYGVLPDETTGAPMIVADGVIKLKMLITT